MPTARIDLQLLLIVLLTAIVSSRAAVKIPRFNTSVTISDTFVFLALLLYGSEIAIALAALDGLISTTRAGKKLRTILFGAATMACSTSITVLVLRAFFGAPDQLGQAALSIRF